MLDILRQPAGKRSTPGGWKDVAPPLQEVILPKKKGGGARGGGLRAPAGLADLFAGGRMPNPAALGRRGGLGSARGGK